MYEKFDIQSITADGIVVRLKGGHTDLIIQARTCGIFILTTEPALASKYEETFVGRETEVWERAEELLTVFDKEMFHGR